MIKDGRHLGKWQMGWIHKPCSDSYLISLLQILGVDTKFIHLDPFSAMLWCDFDHFSNNGCHIGNDDVTKNSQRCQSGNSRILVLVYL